MAHALERYKKTSGDGPAATIFLEDWNGVLDTAGSLLAQLVQKGADFDAVANVAIGVLLDRINAVLSPAYDQVAARGEQVETLYAQLSAMGISASAVQETADRLFLTAARRAAILSDSATQIRGDVDAAGDTLAKVYALYTTLKGGADAAHDTLGELAVLIDANTAAVASRLRGDADGGYGTGVRDQFRINIGGAAPSAVTISGPLAAADFDRPVYFTGSPTITMPNAGAGWVSGEIVSDNALTGIGIIAVPPGAYLDGVLNGTQPQWPKQRLRVRQTGATTYRIHWVERFPQLPGKVIAAATAQFDLGLPDGYTVYEVEGYGFNFDATTITTLLRLSFDGGVTFKSGNSDYGGKCFGSDYNGDIGTSGFTVFNNSAPGSSGRSWFRGTLTLGSATTGCELNHDYGGYQGSGTRAGRMSQSTGAAYGRATAVRFVTTSGNITNCTILLRGRGPV